MIIIRYVNLICPEVIPIFRVAVGSQAPWRPSPRRWDAWPLGSGFQPLENHGTNWEHFGEMLGKIMDFWPFNMIQDVLQFCETSSKFMLQHITSSHNPPLRILVSEALHTRRHCQQQNPADISKGYQDVEGETSTDMQTVHVQCTHLVHSSLARSSWTVWIWASKGILTCILFLTKQSSWIKLVFLEMWCFHFGPWPVVLMGLRGFW